MGCGWCFSSEVGDGLVCGPLFYELNVRNLNQHLFGQKRTVHYVSFKSWPQNPLEGRCVAGGFLGPTEKEACANQEFLYEECPDVDECRLGMHNCHEKGNFGWCPPTVGESSERLLPLADAYYAFEEFR